MTAKEKSKELVEKFINNSWDNSWHHMPTIVAKECAKIAVDEIINELLVTDFNNRFEYWQEVKKEINEL